MFNNLDVSLKGFKDVNVLYIQVLLTATSLQVIIYRSFKCGLQFRHWYSLEIKINITCLLVEILFLSGAFTWALIQPFTLKHIMFRYRQQYFDRFPTTEAISSYLWNAKRD